MEKAVLTKKHSSGQTWRQCLSHLGPSIHFGASSCKETRISRCLVECPMIISRRSSNECSSSLMDSSIVGFVCPTILAFSSRRSRAFSCAGWAVRQSAASDFHRVEIHKEPFQRTPVDRLSENFQSMALQRAMARHCA